MLTCSKVSKLTERKFLQRRLHRESSYIIPFFNRQVLSILEIARSAENVWVQTSEYHSNKLLVWNVFNYRCITHYYIIQLLLVFVREECNLCDLMQLDQIRAVFCRIPSLIQPLYLAKLPANWNHKQLRLSPNISTSEADASERKRGKRLKSHLLGYEW